jgi:glycosyltransferase involved in cell wall biosynthesis
MTPFFNARIVVLNWMDISNPKAGGQEKYVYEMSRRLVNSGYRVTLLTSCYPGASCREMISGIEVIRTGNIYTFFIKYFRYYFKLRKDSIFFLSMNAIPFFLPLSRENRLVMIHHRFDLKVMKEKIGVLGYFSYFIQEIISPILYRKDRIITNSISSLEDFTKMGYKNVNVIKSGIDLPKFTSENKKNWIVSPGPIKPWKHHDLVMKAFSKLPKEWELILFGSFESENYKQVLNSLAVELGISERVKFLGRISDNEVERIFMESKLCVLGTEKEGWGLVAMEAQSYGCPVVAFNVPGIRDSVLNRKTGILERFGDVDAMAASMKEFIDNELIYKEMSRLAMERASLYSWDQCYVEFIKQLAAVSKSIKRIEKNMAYQEA